MRLSAHIAAVILAIIAIAAEPAAAQRRGGGGQRGGGGDQGGGGFQRGGGGFQRGGGDRGGGQWGGGGGFNPADFLTRLDENQNGILEPNEVPERAQRFVQRLAEQANVELGGPIPIDRLTGESNNNRNGDGDRNNGGDSSSATELESDVLAFVSTGELQTAPGFDSELTPASATASASASGNSTNSAPSGDPRAGGGRFAGGPGAGGFGGGRGRGPRGGGEGGEDGSFQIRRGAQSLINQYDEDGSGRLEEYEWPNVRGNPEQWDTNKDGIVTLEEATAYLDNYSGGSSSSAARAPEPGESYVVEGPKLAGGRKSERFLTATERLPKGLPDWFTRSDADADGQVQMWEYSTTWNDETVAEFAKNDLDGDGIITVAEALGESSVAKAGTRGSTTSGGSGSSSRATSTSLAPRGGDASPGSFGGPGGFNRGNGGGRFGGGQGNFGGGQGNFGGRRGRGN